MYTFTGTLRDYEASPKTFEIDITSVPDYQSLTTDDMIFALTAGSTFANNQTVGFSAEIRSYDPGTGKVTVYAGIGGNPAGNSISYILGVAK